MRRPISRDALLEGQCLASSWGPGGRVLWLSLALGYFVVARSDEIIRLADRNGVPLALLDEERRGVILRGAAVDLVAVAPGHQHRCSFPRP